MTESEQIDKDIDISSSIDSQTKRGNPSKQKFSRIIWILSITAFLFILILIFPTGDSGSFNTEISSTEQALRDSMYSIACDIHDYFNLNGNLPLVLEDINVSSLSITYTVEDDSSWALMSGDSLIYYSDMDPVEFASGEI